MHSIAARFFSQTDVMSSSTSGFQSHCSGWCGSNRNTGGAPSTFWPGLCPCAWAMMRACWAKSRHRRMVVVVDVLLRVRQHECRMDGAVDIDQPEQRLVGQRDRVVAEVPELDVGDAESFAAALGLLLRARP